MTHMIRSLAAVATVLALAGCYGPPDDSAFYNRGGPEALLDVSQEVVNLSVAGPTELAQLSSWIEQDQPTRAELYCTAGDARCNSARNVMEAHGVPTMLVPSGDYTVALVYERILARDCNQRFADNHRNNWNAPHRAFGCSLSANIVQQVSDKQEFVNPNLTDTPRALGPVDAYDRAYAPKPAAIAPAGGVENSIIQNSKTN
jgi:hypothetical protein